MYVTIGIGFTLIFWAVVDFGRSLFEELITPVEALGIFKPLFLFLFL